VGIVGDHRLHADILDELVITDMGQSALNEPSPVDAPGRRGSKDIQTQGRKRQRSKMRKLGIGII
jgi:hypothetical protein